MKGNNPVNVNFLTRCLVKESIIQLQDGVGGEQSWSSMSCQKTIVSCGIVIFQQEK